MIYEACTIIAVNWLGLIAWTMYDNNRRYARLQDALAKREKQREEDRAKALKEWNDWIAGTTTPITDEPKN